MTQFVDKIKELRKNLGLTQKQFAKKSGLSLSVVSQYEIGTRNPSKRALYSICNTFEVEPKFFSLSEKSPLSKQKDEEKVNSRMVENLLDQNDLLKKHIKALQTENRQLKNSQTQNSELNFSESLNQQLAFEDIVERLDISQNQFDSTFYLSDQPMSVAKNGIIVNVNQAFYDILGYTQKEMVDTTILEYIHPDEHKTAIKEIASGEADIIHRVKKKNGAYCKIRIKAVNFGGDVSDNAVYSVAHMECVDEECKDLPQEDID